MRLKSIKLAGFKSFAEPTRLEFPGDITCIVGPNGCGKSNTLDAIRWVMGESAARALRGGEMNDVLFNGTSQRKPVSRCSVELLFDNSDHRLKGAWNRYAEISVRRAHHREQGTQYYLNGQRCRRRDVVALFDGTGLGPRSYALIGQGSISQIIEARPEQLRQFLEEAAGVGYYRQRRRETLSRLEAARENLEQLRIQQQSWAAQAAQLKQQCEAAERYRALSDEIERLTRWRYQLRYQALSTEIDALRDRLQAVQQEHLRHHQTVETLEKEIILAERSLPELRHQVGQQQQAVHRLDKQIALAEQEKARHEQEKRRLQEALAEQEKALAALEASSAPDDEALIQALAQRPALQARLSALQAQYERLEHALAQQQAEQKQADQHHLSLQQRQLTLKQRLFETRQQLERLRFQQQHLQQQMHALRQQQETLRLEALQDVLSALSETVADAQARHEQAVARLGEARERLRKAQAELETLERAHRQLQSEMTATEAELNGLRRAQESLLPRRSGGTLVSQIQVSSERWRGAVEAWLGSWLQGELMDAPPDKVPDEIPFVGWPVSEPDVRVVPPCADWRPLTAVLGAPSCILQAARLIWCSDTAPSPRQLEELPPEQAVLTPDGCLWRAYGAERLQTELGGVLARQARIDTLEGQRSDQQSRMMALDARLRRQQERVAALRREVADAERQASEMERALQRHQLERTQLQHQLQQGQAQLRQLQAQAPDLKRSLRAVEQEMDALQPQLERLQAELMQLTEQLQRHEQSLRRGEETLHDGQNKLSEMTHEIKSLSSELAILDEKEKQLQARRIRHEARRQQLQEAVAALKRQLAQMHVHEPDAEALASKRTELKRLRDRLHAQRDELKRHESRLDSLRQQLQEAQKAHYGARQRLGEAQLKLEQAQHALQQWVAEAEEAGMTVPLLRQQVLDAPPLSQLEQALRVAKRARERLGAVNMTAIDSWQALSERMAHLQSQMEDIAGAVATLQQSIQRIDRDSRRKLRQTFEAVNGHFQRLFPTIFRGGRASLRWLDPDGDPLENGVLVMAQPPGKRTARIQMLSGGEKTLTALALIFALFELNPAPFCVLDEVDAPLDDANVARFCDLVKSMAQRVQFIIITHNKTTMTVADQLLGVTMHEPGVSRVVSVDLGAAVDMIEETL